MNALADKVNNHACISSTPVGTKFTATYVGKVVTLCAYAQQGYAFGRVGYVRTYMYIIFRQKPGCLVPYRSKIFR